MIIYVYHSSLYVCPRTLAVSFSPSDKFHNIFPSTMRSILINYIFKVVGLCRIIYLLYSRSRISGNFICCFKSSTFNSIHNSIFIKTIVVCKNRSMFCVKRSKLFTVSAVVFKFNLVFVTTTVVSFRLKSNSAVFFTAKIDSLCTNLEITFRILSGIYINIKYIGIVTLFIFGSKSKFRSIDLKFYRLLIAVMNLQ